MAEASRRRQIQPVLRHSPPSSSGLAVRTPTTSTGGSLSATIRPRVQKKTCMCSPTNHPGSFRCGLHKSSGAGFSSSPNRLNGRRSAMTSSLVRIGGVEGDLVKRALAALIRPSSHNQRRRYGFRPRRSRLSVMTKSEDL